TGTQNMELLKVAELKQELKLRGLTVSGTKNDLIERLRNYQESKRRSTAHAACPGLQLPRVRLQSPCQG
uniref:SAP domain-containing protein n=1 Tax=Seriola lalandi dorsalis TaxID=1841481 RepID=A0A3B4X4T4_SERLL